jgi:hypothetical protein
VDSHKEDAADCRRPAMVLHQRARLLGAHHLCMRGRFDPWDRLADTPSTDVLHHLCKELLHSPQYLLQ